MCSIQVARQGLCSLAGLTLSVALAMSAAAQTPAAPPSDPNPGNMTLTGSFDAVSTYMFRGIRQNSTGIALWPAADLGVAIFSGNGGMKSVGANVDNTFGYASVAGLVTVPLGGTTSFGAWNLHGGVEFQALGDTTKALNGGDGHKVIVSAGIGFVY
jgi:hypothetical protein